MNHLNVVATEGGKVGLETQSPQGNPHEETGYPYNPKHAIGTCASCGKEMSWNVPRLGPDGGFIHKDSGGFMCEIITPKEVLDESASRMLRSIQDTLGFSAAEDAILKWLEGCSLEGVERLAICLEDYL